MKPTLLVSRCLLGDICRYDGQGRQNEEVCRLSASFRLITVCPETDGGLPTPRPPAERQGTCVRTASGCDVTDAYRRGAQVALSLALRERVCAAVLKSRSPSCGKGEIYDGTFSRRLTQGDGMTAELLILNGIPVYTEEETEAVISRFVTQ